MKYKVTLWWNDLDAFRNGFSTTQTHGSRKMSLRVMSNVAKWHHGTILYDTSNNKRVELERNAVAGNTHLNSEGGSIITEDFLVLTDKDYVVLKMKKNLSLP